MEKMKWSAKSFSLFPFNESLPSRTEMFFFSNKGGRGDSYFFNMLYVTLASIKHLLGKPKHKMLHFFSNNLKYIKLSKGRFCLRCLD